MHVSFLCASGSVGWAVVSDVGIVLSVLVFCVVCRGLVSWLYVVGTGWERDVTFVIVLIVVLTFVMFPVVLGSCCRCAPSVDVLVV